MYHLPEYNYISKSLRLSKAMSDNGVNQWVVSRKRRNALLKESMLRKVDNKEGKTIFIFGSTTEVSTTFSLDSDFDCLLCIEFIEGIQEMRDWRRGKTQCMMIQNEFTFPGYCLLKTLRDDIPAFATHLQLPWHIMDNAGNLFMTHSDFYVPFKSTDRHIHVNGPALSSKPTRYVYAADKVLALKCQSWPHEAEPWLELHSKDGWPSDDIKRYAKDHGCFLVPVSGKTCAYPGLEWRISTSKVERRLMFSLNITQLRCYILLKMINKTYLKPTVDVISSFMCKCILFHCIARSTFQDWQEHTLVTCLIKCLQGLLQSIQTESCPHFIIPKNNLLAGKLTADIKFQTENILTFMIGNIDQTLQRIAVVHLVLIRCVDIRDFQKRLVDQSTLEMAISVGFFLYFLYDRMLSENNCPVATLKRFLNQMMQSFLNGKAIDQIAFRILFPFLCSVIGTTLASDNIQHFRALSAEVMDWFKLGFCSDVAFCKLQFASVLFCAGKFRRCKHVLKGLCRMFTRTAVFCCCLCDKYKVSESIRSRYHLFYYQDEQQFVREHVAFCVQFWHSERHCTPEELQYEMFRSTYELLKGTESKKTRKVAVVDPLSYLYFLQYKVYQKLRKRTKQLSALTNLIQTIDSKPDLWHKETALNLLGKCMEQENRNDWAMIYYVKSMILRPINNAANWHIMLLLFSTFKKKRRLRTV